jgi:hypothetical protein
MTTCVFSSLRPAILARTLVNSASARQDRVAESVAAALSAVESSRQLVSHQHIERRREARYPYPYPIHLTPFDQSGRPDLNRSFVVIGKHLAPHGIDFYCSQPLAERRVIASLDCGGLGWVGFIVELTWCRFSRHGWYDNGGRFVSVVPPPIVDRDGRPNAA